MDHTKHSRQAIAYAVTVVVLRSFVFGGRAVAGGLLCCGFATEPCRLCLHPVYFGIVLDVRVECVGSLSFSGDCAALRWGLGWGRDLSCELTIRISTGLTMVPCASSMCSAILSPTFVNERTWSVIWKGHFAKRAVVDVSSSVLQCCFLCLVDIVDLAHTRLANLALTLHLLLSAASGIFVVRHPMRFSQVTLWDKVVCISAIVIAT
jgi:hypothetical protein